MQFVNTILRNFLRTEVDVFQTVTDAEVISCSYNLWKRQKRFFKYNLLII